MIAVRNSLRRAVGQLPSLGLSPARSGQQLGWQQQLQQQLSTSTSVVNMRYFPLSRPAGREASSLSPSSTMSPAVSKTVTCTRRTKASSPVIRLPAQYDRAAQYSTSPLPSPARIPKNSWDSHMHVVDPANYPLSPTAAYTPHSHLLPEAMKFESSVALANIVLVQPSIYGNDNSCMLDALREIGPKRGRAVVGCDPGTVAQETLQEWHEIGVRGVRVNLKSVGREVVESELSQELQQYADMIRPLKWVLELFIGLESLPILERIVPSLGVKVCIAHFGAPAIPKTFSVDNSDPYSLPGFRSLINLLEQGNTYVKLSAPYRFSNDKNQRDIEILAKEILRVGSHRAVFATDWPHTRFDGVDIKPFIQSCLEWCGEDEQMAERLFRRNAEVLWDAES